MGGGPLFAGAFHSQTLSPPNNMENHFSRFGYLREGGKYNYWHCLGEGSAFERSLLSRISFSCWSWKLGLAYCITKRRLSVQIMIVGTLACENAKRWVPELADQHWLFVLWGRDWDWDRGWGVNLESSWCSGEIMSMMCSVVRSNQHTHSENEISRSFISVLRWTTHVSLSNRVRENKSPT